MKFDILLAGVGGQGVLSVAAIIAAAAVKEGLTVKQSEVHGMAQRGGSVSAHLRLSDGPIWSDLIPRGGAQLMISVEPLEAFRHFDHLAPGGAVVSASGSIHDLPGYPDEALVLERLRSFGRVVLVDAARLAKQAGLAQATGVVLVGAAAGFLPLDPAALEAHLREAFAAKGTHVVEANVRAFRAGREAGAGAPPLPLTRADSGGGTCL